MTAAPYRPCGRDWGEACDCSDCVAHRAYREAKSGLGVKYDSVKPQMALLPYYPLEDIAKVLAFGALKYDAHNWRNGLELSRLLSATMRHLGQFNEGENVDPESGLSHLAHAGCNILFALEMMRTHPELDDRYHG